MGINSVNKAQMQQAYIDNSKTGSNSKRGEKSGAAAGSGAADRADKLEISAAARQASKIKTVKSKVDEGFYDRPEVMRETARKINNQFQPNKTA